MADDWTRLVDRRLAALETRGAVDDVHRAAVEKRLSAIEDTLKWLVRLILGTLVLGVMAFALGGGLDLAPVR
ncbi:pseudouridine synthase [Histidinibacterium lentulum]|uniref:Pseudouridine synthase n=1 Tax=Histidinibacterium lentulum TaxID=2480588 RepID=A0A3N2QKX6_9RHOB|nr:pseudouridine synthase [Histidinibacterium lentulum]ROT95849.1 pseudouridine synthase [Histidinibacterium lentulum]